MTLPIHAALPAAALLPVPTDWLVHAFTMIHLGFPVVLLATWRWWRGQALDLAIVIGLDHVVTLAVVAVWGA